MEPFKWGMIGSVEKAQVFSAETRFTSNAQCLKAFLPLSGETIDILKTFPGTTICSTVQDLLQAGIDAVYIASHHSLHYQQIIQCLERKMPVLCEHPLADNPTQLTDLIEQSVLCETFLMEALWIRFKPVIRKVLSLISSGWIGAVTSLRASVYYKAGETILPAGTDVGGGALFELGTFPVFLSCLFLGQPSHIKAVGKLTHNGEVEDFSAFFSYEKGQYAFIQASVVDQMDSFIDICGDKGNIYIKNPWSAKPEGLELDLADGTKMVHKSDWQGMGLYFEMDEVETCIQKGINESPFYSHQFTLDVSHVLDKIKMQLTGL
jgi:scyllo-inositol 2-dehydrogenase (NADP+)